MSKVDFEFIHNELYGTALEVSKKFISPHFNRPILNYALHSEDGSLIATDSHKLIRVKGIHGFKEEYLVSPITLMFAKGKFLSFEDVLNKEKHKMLIRLNKEQIKLWLQTFKSINQILRTMKDKSGKVMIVFKNEFLEVVLDSQKIAIQLPFELYVKTDMAAISFNPEHLRDTLEAHQKLNSTELNFYFNGDMRPVIIDDCARVTTVIMPLRTY